MHDAGASCSAVSYIPIPRGCPESTSTCQWTQAVIGELNACCSAQDTSLLNLAGEVVEVSADSRLRSSPSACQPHAADCGHREKALLDANGSARHCGLTQPRINDLGRGRVSRFPLDALVNIATAIGGRVRVE